MLSRRAAIKSLMLSGIGWITSRNVEANGFPNDHLIEEISIRAMGSDLNVRWQASETDVANARKIRDEISVLLEKWNAILSDYDDESEASVLSHPQNIGRWQNVSVELTEAITRSKKWFDVSQGAFDVTCGAVTALRRKRREVKAEEWEAALKTIGWDAIEWDEEQRAIKINRKGLKFDFGGIGKGLAVDKVSNLMERLSLDRYIANFSGNLRTGNPPSDRDGWPVELEFLGADSNDDRAPYRFRLANLSMATSGGQFQNFPDWKSKTQQDKTSHIIDPQDGGGLVGRQLVTIFAAEASDADAAATAGCVQLRRNNGQWLSELSGRENGMFGIAQEIIQGKSNVIEFGGFSEKLNFIRS